MDEQNTERKKYNVLCWDLGSVLLPTPCLSSLIDHLLRAYNIIGAVAQMVERALSMREVMGSMPIFSNQYTRKVSNGPSHAAASSILGV